MKKSILSFIILLICGFSMAQKDGYRAVESFADYEGIWIAVDTVSMQLLEDEFAPTGIWLVLDETSSYFSSYLDPEWGASIDIGFDYTRNSNTFNCTLVQSNSVGYLMEHENEAFRFKLYSKLFEDERYLRLENDYGKTYDLVLYTID